jgi:Uma2 family endonuclease
MGKAQTPVKFTYDDYKSLPFSETKRYELLGGELIQVPSPSFAHQRISWELEYRLSQYVREHQLGIVLDAPLDVVFGEGDEREVAQPDILYISNERREIIHEEQIRGAPDLLIEILSPSTADYDRHYKRTLYARHGAAEYWLVDPDSQTIEVLTLGKRGYRRAELYTGDQRLRSPLLPEFAVQPAEIF